MRPRKEAKLNECSIKMEKVVFVKSSVNGNDDNRKEAGHLKTECFKKKSIVNVFEMSEITYENQIKGLEQNFTTMKHNQDTTQR